MAPEAAGHSGEIRSHQTADADWRRQAAEAGEIEMMLRGLLLAALMCFAIQPAHARDPLYGDMTEAQIKAVQMTSIAYHAGTHNVCPRYHLIENAEFAEWADAKIPTEMVDTTDSKNVQAVAWMGAIERQSKNPSDFCLAAWQLFGPNGLYRRQLLEAN